MFDPRIKRLLALLIILAACVSLLLIQRRHQRPQANKHGSPASLISPELLAQFTSLERREQQTDDTTWALERRAERFGAVFDDLWDQFNSSSNRFQLLAAFPVAQLFISRYATTTRFVHE